MTSHDFIRYSHCIMADVPNTIARLLKGENLTCSIFRTDKGISAKEGILPNCDKLINLTRECFIPRPILCDLGYSVRTNGDGAFHLETSFDQGFVNLGETFGYTNYTSKGCSAIGYKSLKELSELTTEVIQQPADIVICNVSLKGTPTFRFYTSYGSATGWCGVTVSELLRSFKSEFMQSLSPSADEVYWIVENGKCMFGSFSYVLYSLQKGDKLIHIIH